MAGIAALACASTKRVHRQPHELVVRALLGATLLLGCTPRSQPAGSTDEGQQPEARACPTEAIEVERARDVGPEHERAEFWLAKLDPDLADEVLIDANERAFLAERVSSLPGGWRDPIDAMSLELVETELRERMDFLRERVASGKYVEGREGALEEAGNRIARAQTVIGPDIRFVVEETPLWCVPTSEGLYTTPVDPQFDRNRCASLHPGEYVGVLRTLPVLDGWVYVNAGHSVGWISRPDRALGPTLDDEAVRERLARAQVFINADLDGLRLGSSFPLSAREGDQVTILVPGNDGPEQRSIPAHVASTEPWPLTRRKLFTQAFSLLEQPYGWGGRDGYRDCSRYLLDLFALFDVRLARNSGVQAELGTRSVDLSELDDEAKRAAIREAANTGVVLLYMPGHIMLYLGQDGAHDFGISALSEYLEPCPGGPDTVYKIDKVAVTTLEVGRGTERRAFIERISKMAVFGPPPI